MKPAAAKILFSLLALALVTVIDARGGDYTGKAGQHAREVKASSKNDLYSRIATIRNSLAGERDYEYHVGQMEHHLKWAAKYASEGDRAMMEHEFRQANHHGREARAASRHDLQARITTIRNSLTNEHEYHLGEMEYHLEWASAFAHKGDRAMMEHEIGQAKQHARKAGVQSANVPVRIAAIRQLLDDAVTKIE